MATINCYLRRNDYLETVKKLRKELWKKPKEKKS